MIEVPGMTRPALDAMSPQDVEAMRWALFARALTPSITSDLAGQLEQLWDEERRPTAATLQRRNAERREVLEQAKTRQAELRVLLLLDEDGDVAEDGD